MILTIVGELKRLTIVLIAQKADDLLEGILRGARDAKFIGLNGDLDLELLVLDVFVDLLGSRLVDSLDDMADETDGATGSRLGIIPLDRLDVDAALNELARKHIDDLSSDEIRWCVERKELVGLGKLDRGA